ncbi:MAG TPA: imidazoleglycerol-phosphate dehydratase HisB [Candidatus Aveggerthella stercoripullorum]|uniref:Imidazoleglycerol-phosphate dehydratase n=1 Tax=Candidatus Aveggerthella stercoripullorum TaxID=2840688 RepID=A0A9D0ZZI9_9ACTN|nr:imidazoleglycerol-phosphate dehydratase HisB [Candidatus Aveggerthella stercoripullorum]
MTERIVERRAEATRDTKETQITVVMDLDGAGTAHIDTPVPFFNHMLDAFTRHSLLDMRVEAEGDVDVDDHHTVEDIGIVMGSVLREALGTKAGIGRFGQALVPMDEALVLCALDISGRGQAFFEVPFQTQTIGGFDTQLVKEFFLAFARAAGITLHLRLVVGENSHHVAEACFKACGRALRQAVELDSRVTGIPSTKGSL